MVERRRFYRAFDRSLLALATLSLVSFGASAQDTVKATLGNSTQKSDKPAAPGGGLLQSQGQGPMNVEADQGIEWQQSAKAYIARGNAKATRGEVTLYADTLTAYYREVPNSQSTEIWRVVADGNVRIVRPNETVTGEKGVYDIDKAVVVLTGKNLKLTTPEDVVTARDALEWYDQKQLAIARGDALGVRDDRHIRADVLAAHIVNSKTNPPPHLAGKAASSSPKTLVAAHPKGSSGSPTANGGNASNDGSRIQRIDASGHVVVTSESTGGEDQVGSGDKGVYDLDRGLATLVGHVTLARGDDSMVGEYGVMDLNTGVSRLLPRLPSKAGARHGRVQGYVIPDQDDDEQEADNAQ